MSAADPEHVRDLLREELADWTGGPSGLHLPPFPAAPPPPGVWPCTTRPPARPCC